MTRRAWVWLALALNAGAWYLIFVLARMLWDVVDV